MAYKNIETRKITKKKYYQIPAVRAKSLEASKAYSATKKGKEAKLRGQRKYSSSEKGKACKKRWYSTDKGKAYKESGRLMRKYGITLHQKEVMYNNQNGLCALCKQVLPENFRRSMVEHNHVTKKIRGLTHTKCNTFIAFIEDTPQIIDYIKKYLKEELKMYKKKKDVDASDCNIKQLKIKRELVDE